MSEIQKISILGKEIQHTHDLVQIDRLMFLKENPRIRAVLGRIPGFEGLIVDEQQEKIFTRLLDQPSVKKLITAIKHHGGLIEPILVRQDTLEVVEGNCRLAAYRWLRDQNSDPIWDRIPCNVVSSLTITQQFALLDQLHVQGKHDWSAYAKAHHYHNYVNGHDFTVSKLAEIGSDSEDFIKKRVATIDLMLENQDDIESHFSYYEELIKSSKLKPLMREPKHENLREYVLSEIRKTEKDFTAQELRDRLPTIMQRRKICNQLVRGDLSFEEAYDLTKTSKVKAKFDDVLKKLIHLEDNEINKLDFEEIRAAQVVARKVSKKAERLLSLVERRVEETR